MITFQAPKDLTKNNILEFLRKVEKTYEWKNALVPDVNIDLTPIKKIDILGLLIIYKFIDFTYTHFCFKNPNLQIDEFINETWAKYKFDKLIQAYIANKGITDQPFKELSVKFEDKFIIAPQALLRDTAYSNEYLKTEFIPKIEQYYSDIPKVSDLIFSCFSEILLNFWEHAAQDTKSIILADGNKSKIEIACADSGVGIVSNLNAHFSGSIKKDDLLCKCVQKGVTSKPNSNHMGFGLWLINELTTINSGKLHLYSEGYYYYNDNGKISSGSCAFWPGTIIYLNISLKNPKTLSDVQSDINLDSIKINFS